MNCAPDTSIPIPLPWYGRPSADAVAKHRGAHWPGYWLVKRPRGAALQHEDSKSILLGTFDEALCFGFQGAHSSEDWEDWERMGEWVFRPLDSDGAPLIDREALGRSLVALCDLVMVGGGK